MCYSDRDQFTNLDHEITGAYYEEKTPWYVTAAYCFLGLVFIFLTADLIFGAEAVTYWLASLIS